MKIDFDKNFFIPNIAKLINLKNIFYGRKSTIRQFKRK